MGALSGPVDGFLLNRIEAAGTAALIRIAVAQLQRVNGTAPASAIALAAALERFARTSSPQADAGREHANLPDSADLALSGPRIGVTAAAELAGYSPQHIRLLCRRGELLAVRSPSGGWEIDEHSAAMIARRRKDAQTCLTVSPSG
jgi:hypothetical protein